MKTNSKAQGVALAVFASIALTNLPAQAAVVYLRSMAGAPWGVSTNESAMDAVFGAGAWSDLRYETLNPGVLFTSNTTFIFMEGGDLTANEMESFLTSNLSLIQSWVSNGGSLFLNAAPNEGDGMDFGFGVMLNYPAGSSMANAANPSHPIFQGPYGATGSSFTGSSFSHATVSGSLTPLITVSFGTILGEADYGLGHVLFGGMTTANFQNPQPQATDLRKNILAYGASQAVPEPSAIALIATGAGIAFFFRRLAPLKRQNSKAKVQA